MRQFSEFEKGFADTVPAFPSNRQAIAAANGRPGRGPRERFVQEQRLGDIVAIPAGQ